MSTAREATFIGGYRTGNRMALFGLINESAPKGERGRRLIFELPDEHIPKLIEALQRHMATDPMHRVTTEFASVVLYEEDVAPHETDGPHYDWEGPQS